MKILIVNLLFAACAVANCGSKNAAYSGNWRPGTQAPHDGTVVELMQTYGLAPTYGLFKWTRDIPSMEYGKIVFYTTENAVWINLDHLGMFMADSECIYWRPYRATSYKYADPTGGAQHTAKYWCNHMGVKYDTKTDRCIR